MKKTLSLFLVCTLLVSQGMASESDVQHVLSQSQEALNKVNTQDLQNFVKEAKKTQIKIDVKDVQELHGSTKKCTKDCTSFLTHTDSTNLKEAQSSLLVFVSWSLGHETLVSLGKQVQQLGGRMVMRGLKNNSFKDTHALLLNLGVGVEIDIDPPLFEELDITHAPTFVIRETDESGAVTTDKVIGSMSVKAAIGIMADEGETLRAKMLKAQLMWGGK